MSTSTLIDQRPTRLTPAYDLAAGAGELCEVVCACGFRDHDIPGHDPTAFLARTLEHLEDHHPEVLDHLSSENMGVDTDIHGSGRADPQLD